MTSPKISPAFNEYLTGVSANVFREALVVYRLPESARSAAKSIKNGGRGHALQEIKSSSVSVRTNIHQAYMKGRGRKRNKPEMKFPGNDILPVATLDITAETLDLVAEIPDVVAVLPNQKIGLIRPTWTAAEGARKEDKSSTWGLEALQVEELWAKANEGQEINVAVLDTGVYGEHEAIKNRIRDFVVVDPLGRIVRSDAFDAAQHGTHVCGTIAGSAVGSEPRIGVAPQSNLFVAAVLVGDATLDTLVSGMAWAVENEADIINMSLGFSYYEPLFESVVDELLNLDVLPVVAIGNENHGNSACPGNIRGALSVGATVRGEPQTVAAFSSGATISLNNGDDVVNPDIVAPGSDVYSCIPMQKTRKGKFDYAYMSGTSMAAPHVSGIAAVLRAAAPDASAQQISDVLRETAKHPLGADFGPDNRWGHGLVQPLEALASLVTS